MKPKKTKKKTEADEQVWTHFILEAFCGYSFMHILVSSVNAKDFMKEGLAKNKKIKYRRIKNKDYIEAKPCDLPGKPHPDKCMSSKEEHKLCPFFLWSSVGDYEYKAMIRAWEKMPRKNEKNAVGAIELDVTDASVKHDEILYD